MDEPRLTASELLDATRQMAVLVRLGFPLSDGLRSMAQDGRRWLGKLGNSLEAGDTLSEAVGRHPSIFSAFYAGMVEAAEASGHPEEILDSLSHWLERADRVHKQARTALYYPLLLLNAALLQIILVVMLVAPAALLPLAQMTGHLIPTKAVSVLQSPQLAVVFAIVLALLNIAALRAETTIGLIARIPGIGPLLRMAQQGLWAEALGSLLAAGVPLPAALRQSTSVVTERGLLKLIERLPELVERGDSLSDALVSVPGLAPCLSWSVVAGERREDLAPLVLDAAAYIDREVDLRMQHALRLLEPWVQVAVGVVVCSALLAFWMPYYTLVGSIH